MYLNLQWELSICLGDQELMITIEGDASFYTKFNSTTTHLFLFLFFYIGVLIYPFLKYMTYSC